MRDFTSEAKTIMRQMINLCKYNNLDYVTIHHFAGSEDIRLTYQRKGSDELEIIPMEVSNGKRA